QGPRRPSPSLFVRRALVTFFFSSRRRHTRCYRDWSSDVCSSDLEAMKPPRSLLVLLAGLSLLLPMRAQAQHVDPDARAHAQDLKIGRASCRERVEMTAGAVARQERTRSKRRWPGE